MTDIVQESRRRVALVARRRVTRLIAAATAENARLLRAAPRG